MNEAQAIGAQEALDQHARDEFDADGNESGAKRAAKWLENLMLDCPEEVKAIVRAALCWDTTPILGIADAHMELARTVDALRERYVSEREWDAIDRRDILTNADEEA